MYTMLAITLKSRKAILTQKLPVLGSWEFNVSLGLLLIMKVRFSKTGFVFNPGEPSNFI